MSGNGRRGLIYYGTKQWVQVYDKGDSELYDTYKVPYINQLLPKI